MDHLGVLQECSFFKNKNKSVFYFTSETCQRVHPTWANVEMKVQSLRKLFFRMALYACLCHSFFPTPATLTYVSQKQPDLNL